MSKRKRIIKAVEDYDPKRKVLIAILSLAILLGGYWFFMAKPKINNLSELEKENAELNEEIAKFKQKVGQLPEKQDEMEEIDNRLQHAKTLLPKDLSDVESLLADIERLGEEEDVEFLRFEPGDEEERELYAIQYVDLRLEGSFIDLMNYLDKMSGLNRIVTLERIKLKPKGSQHKEDIDIEAPVKIAVYRDLNEEDTEAEEE